MKTLTVAQLIELLQKYDPNLPVVMEDFDELWGEPYDIEVVSVDLGEELSVYKNKVVRLRGE